MRQLSEYSPELRDLLSRISAVAAQINLHGWAEANAGNISVNISSELRQRFETDGDWFLVSRTGSRYRDLARDPAGQLVLIKIQDGVETVYPDQQRPTSEWTCHRLLQEKFLSGGSDDRVVLHAHPTSVILLSQLEIYHDPEALNQSLREALPEFRLFLPDGVATASAAPPGSRELAQNSLAAIGERKALIWQGHGIVCAGNTPDQALDFLEVAEKAAQLALLRFILTKLKH